VLTLITAATATRLRSLSWVIGTSPIVRLPEPAAPALASSPTFRAVCST
jgi:hypothetical protein